ncbi:MAG: SpoIIE family protein phosphatase [SAR324 cluster bacterium]|nr:SpoIIE family protein phosphatase [SAR324 cluster bacterium]
MNKSVKSLLIAGAFVLYVITILGVIGIVIGVVPAQLKYEPMIWLKMGGLLLLTGTILLLGVMKLSTVLNNALQGILHDMDQIAAGNIQVAIQRPQTSEMNEIVEHLKAIQNGLRHKIDDLTTINVAGEVLSGILNEEEALKHVMRILQIRTNIDWGSAYLLSQDCLKFVTFYSEKEDDSVLLFDEAHSVDDAQKQFYARSFKMGEGVIGKSAVTKQIIFVPNTLEYPEYILHGNDFPKTLICVPLMDHQTVVGVLNLSGMPGKVKFHDEDWDFAQTLARMTVTVIKNLQMVKEVQEALSTTRQLNEELLKEMELRQFVEQTFQEAFQSLKSQQLQMVEELEQARDTQRILLPGTLPVHPDIKFFSKYIPMLQIGGDFYNIMELEKDVYGMVVADVTGHGVSAALIAFMVSAIFHESIKSGLSPSLVITMTNGYLENKLESGKFATMFYVIYDTRTRILTYCNAGHPPAVVIRKHTKEVLPITTRGTMVGLFPNSMITYVENSITLEQGDKVLLYTDGIIELADSNGNQMGKERFFDFLKKNCQLPCEELVKKIVKFAHDYSGYSPMQAIVDDKATDIYFNDDITMVGFEVLN